MINSLIKPVPTKVIYLLLILVTPLFLWLTLLKIKPTNANHLVQSTDSVLLKSTLPNPSLLPIKTIDKPIQLVSQAVVVVDVDSMSFLYEHNSDIALPLASTTKIMTAIIALEHYQPNDWLIVNGVSTDGSNIGLIHGERYKVSDLLGALLVGSANDAAEVLASNFSGGVDGFVWAMNQKAQILSMKNTHFTNPIGYDHPDHYSTARDLAILSAEIIKQPLLASFISRKQIEISDEANHKILSANNTNELLSRDPSVFGIKTGWTEAAGECLIAYVIRDNHPLITVVLGSNNRFEDTEKIIDWVYQSYTWQDITIQSMHRLLQERTPQNPYLLQKRQLVVKNYGADLSHNKPSMLF